MQKVVRYKEVNYPADLKSELYMVDFMDILTQREKDIILVLQKLSAARSALTPNILTKPSDFIALAHVKTLTEKNNWQMLLETPVYEEGYTSNGDDFYNIEYSVRNKNE